MDVVDCKFILSVPFCVCVCDLSQYVLVQHLVQFMAGYVLNKLLLLSRVMVLFSKL